MSPDHYALFGHPVELSLSPEIHLHFADSLGESLMYLKKDILPDNFTMEVSHFFEHGGKGLNITLPHKEAAFRLADEVSEDAAIAGAANTLWLNNHKIHADNTDGRGFIQDLLRLDIPLEHQSILISGAGGAVRGILAPLLKQNPGKVFIANRTLEKAEQLARDFNHLGPVCALPLDIVHLQSTDLLINGISLQQAPSLNPRLNSQASYYDIKYGKAAEASLLWAKERGFNKICDGWGMLVSQAAESYKIWRGKMPDITKVLKWNDK